MFGNQNVENATENEHDLWRWYTQIYLTEIIHPPKGLQLIIDKLKETNLGQIIENVKKIFMPKKTNLDTPAPQSNENNNPPTKAPQNSEKTTPVKQNGGGLFCQKDYKIAVYYKFRIDSYNDLMIYLKNNNIKISLLTKQLLKKLYLYHYSLDYVKALNYILFKIKDYTLPEKLRVGISNLFEQIRNELFNNLNK